MRRKFLLLVCLLLMVSVFFSQVGNSYATDSTNTGSFVAGSSYYFIHYNGVEQNIAINDNVTLTLTGWTDETKSSVKGKLDIHTDSVTQTQDITMSVTDELKDLTIDNNETIHYRLVVSDTFNAEKITPLDLKNQTTVIAQNENGTSIEEVKTIDEYGTVIQNQGLTYYKMDQSNQKVVITEAEYNSLNAATNSTASSGDTSQSQTPVEMPSISYKTHVQDYGWQSLVSDGAMAGTQGEAKRLEAITISVGNVQDLGVKYSTHVQDYGWLNYVSDGAASGTTGQAKRLEAIKIELTGAKASNYDIYYRVHSQDFGWLGWAKNGEPAGTQGQSKRLEAIEIVIVAKGSAAPGPTDKSYLPTPSVVYSTHVQDYGWMGSVANGATSGTQGQAKRLEAIKIDLTNNSTYSGGITYSTHVQDYGWMKEVSNGEIAGTTGESKRLEAIEINLTGDLANYFDVYYRVHSQDYGWLGWAKNGMKAGTEGLGKRLEAIEIKIVPKGQGEPVTGNAAFKQPFKVFIDAGHGGSDPGAIGGGYQEKTLNLAVAKKVQSLLESRGYTVYMSRSDDTFIPLLDRSQMANNVHADIFVSIHHNSTPSGIATSSGVESYYYQYDPGYPSKINAGTDTDPIRIAKSVSLAKDIQKNLVSYTGASDNGIAGETYSVVRESAMPATLLELGYINNPNERQKLITDSYQNSEATAIADGIDKYFFGN